MQNLEVTQAAETAYNKCAKTNKTIGQQKALPWYCIFVIKEETVDISEQYPPEGERLDVDANNWQEKVWDPLVDLISRQYAKNACLVVVDVLYTTAEGNPRSQSVFFKWCPDTGVPVRTKMLIGASFQAVKKKLDVQGITPEVSQRSHLDLQLFAELAHLKGYPTE